MLAASVWFWLQTQYIHAFLSVGNQYMGNCHLKWILEHLFLSDQLYWEISLNWHDFSLVVTRHSQYLIMKHKLAFCMILILKPIAKRPLKQYQIQSTPGRMHHSWSWKKKKKKPFVLLCLVLIIHLFIVALGNLFTQIFLCYFTDDRVILSKWQWSNSEGYR